MANAHDFATNQFMNGVQTLRETIESLDALFDRHLDVGLDFLVQVLLTAPAGEEGVHASLSVGS